MISYEYFWKHKNELPDGSGNNLGWRYLLTLVLLVLLFFILIRLYRHLSIKKKRTTMIIMAALMPLLEIGRILWLLEAGEFQFQEDLPLQLCRIMLFLQSAAIISDKPSIKTLCFAAGMPGAVMAFVLPDISAYPVFTFEYLRYVLSHFLLVLVPFLWIFGDKFNPHADLRILLGTVFAAALVMLGINSLLDSNYFYVSRIPGHVQITLSQPWYFIAIVSFMMVIVTLTMLPFMLHKANENRAVV